MKILFLFIAFVCAVLALKTYGAEHLIIQRVYSSIRGAKQQHEITTIDGRCFIFRQATIHGPITNDSITINGKSAYIASGPEKLVFRMSTTATNVFIHAYSVPKKLVT